MPKGLCRRGMPPASRQAGPSLRRSLCRIGWSWPAPHRRRQARAAPPAVRRSSLPIPSTLHNPLRLLCRGTYRNSAPRRKSRCRLSNSSRHRGTYFAASLIEDVESPAHLSSAAVARIIVADLDDIRTAHGVEIDHSGTPALRCAAASMTRPPTTRQPTPGKVAAIVGIYWCGRPSHGPRAVTDGLRSRLTTAAAEAPPAM